MIRGIYPIPSTGSDDFSRSLRTVDLEGSREEIKAYRLCDWNVIARQREESPSWCESAISRSQISFFVQLGQACVR